MSRDHDQTADIALERAEWGDRIAAGPNVRLSVNQAQLIADFLGVSRRRVLAAWEHAMKNGVPIDPEHLKPPGESVLDSPADRAAFAALSSAKQVDRDSSRDDLNPLPNPPEEAAS